MLSAQRRVHCGVICLDSASSTLRRVHYPMNLGEIRSGEQSAISGLKHEMRSEGRDGEDLTAFDGILDKGPLTYGGLVRGFVQQLFSSYRVRTLKPKLLVNIFNTI